jgi:ubiquinone/menaquinone biosynthesis C-methylase UbiE
MERSDQAQAIEQAFTAQAASFNASTMANTAAVLDELVDAADPQPGQRWLEAACGPGIVTRRLAPRTGSVLGVDLTPAMVELGRREAEGAGLGNVDFQVADATATGLADASFDGAITRFSLHHIPLPGRLVTEMARLVRPGGRVVVLDHLADDDVESLAWVQEVERLRDPSHWASVSRAHLHHFGWAADLELVDERRFGFELDFDDWLRRGTDDPSAHALVERSLAARPEGTTCFQIRSTPDGRVLTLQMWLGVWRRP